jgi:hypothetical protein
MTAQFDAGEEKRGYDECDHRRAGDAAHAFTSCTAMLAMFNHRLKLRAETPTRWLAGSPNETQDKPRQGAVASSLALTRSGAVGFIDWLGPLRRI